MFGSFFFALEHFQVGVGITWFSVLDGLRVKMFSRLIYFFQCVLFSAILAVWDLFQTVICLVELCHLYQQCVCLGKNQMKKTHLNPTMVRRKMSHSHQVNRRYYILMKWSITYDSCGTTTKTPCDMCCEHLRWMPGACSIQLTSSSNKCSQLCQPDIVQYVLSALSAFFLLRSWWTHLMFILCTRKDELNLFWRAYKLLCLSCLCCAYTHSRCF